MEEITLFDKTFVPYIKNAEIESAIDALAARVNKDFENTDSVPIFLCVLNGAVMFTAAMMKKLNFTAQLVSIKVSSYEGTQSTGTVLIPMGLTGSVEDRDVIIFEDIVDTGTTILALKELLKKKGARSVRICTMLLKPDVYDKPDKLDYVGMEIPNNFIVGYGLDYNEIGRNLPDIYTLKK